MAESRGSSAAEPGTVPSRGRNVLVVTSVERSAAALREALGNDIDELQVVVPAVRQSPLQWLANEEDDARERADEAAAAIGEALPANETETGAGDSDPVLAVADALRQFDADEVVVVTRPDEDATWLEEGKGREILRELHGVPVRRLELGAGGDEPRVPADGEAHLSHEIREEAARLVSDPIHELARLREVALEGESAATPLVVISGVTIVIAAVFVIFLALALTAYLIAG